MKISKCNAIWYYYYCHRWVSLFTKLLVRGKIILNFSLFWKTFMKTRSERCCCISDSGYIRLINLLNLSHTHIYTTYKKHHQINWFLIVYTYRTGGMIKYKWTGENFPTNSILIWYWYRDIVILTLTPLSYRHIYVSISDRWDAKERCVFRLYKWWLCKIYTVNVWGETKYRKTWKTRT